MRSADGAEGVGDVVITTVRRLDRAADGGPVGIIRVNAVGVEIGEVGEWKIRAGDEMP